MAKRVVLFVLTNLAVLLVLSVILAVLEATGVLAGLGSYGPLLIFAALFGFGGSFISLAISKWIAKRSTGAQVIETPANATESWLLQTVDRLARDAGIEPPEVAIYDSPDMNAFATGARRNAALVAVSTGLLRGMERDEVEAVLAHEVSHVANGDMVTMTLIQGVLNTFVIFFARIIGQTVDSALGRGEQRGFGYGPGYLITTLFAEMVLGVAAMVIVMWFSRWREFRADAGSARLKGAGPMVAALRRLHAGPPSDLPESLRAFGIRGGGSGVLAKLFRSHPPIEERIARLQGPGAGVGIERAPAWSAR